MKINIPSLTETRFPIRYSQDSFVLESGPMPIIYNSRTGFCDSPIYDKELKKIKILKKLNRF